MRLFLNLRLLNRYLMDQKTFGLVLSQLGHLKCHCLENCSKKSNLLKKLAFAEVYNLVNCYQVTLQIFLGIRHQANSKADLKATQVFIMQISRCLFLEKVTLGKENACGFWTGIFCYIPKIASLISGCQSICKDQGNNCQELTDSFFTVNNLST